MRGKIIALVIILLSLFAMGDFYTVYGEAGTAPVAAPKMEKPSTDGRETDKLSLDLKGMDVVEVIKMLAAKANLSVIVSSSVRGKVTLFLKSVRIMDAFDIILIANGLAYDKRGDIYYVMPQREYEAIYGESYADKKEMKVFQLKYAKASEIAKALSQTKTKIGKIVVDDGSNTIIAIDSAASLGQMQDTIKTIDLPTETRIFDLRYAKAADLKAKVLEVLTKNIGAVQVDERTNKIAVTDLEKRMDDITTLVLAFDDKLQQVLIEAKIVQVTLDDRYKLGVDWTAVITNLQKEINIKSTFEITAMNALVPGSQVVVGALGSSDYAAMIQALKTVGDTNLLSSPRITALNNQEAKILVGTSQPYATNTVTQGTSTTTTAANLNFIDVGIKLYVTPTINKDSFVTMKIKPEVSSVASYYEYGSPTTKVPVVSTTQAETSVTIKDGATIIIAGLIKDERDNTVSKIPFLGDIPIAGEMFKRTEKGVKKQEIVVFLTPHIVSGEESYLKSPVTPPIGEKRFTQMEKPAFERRTRADMDPSYFKEPRKTFFGKEEDSAPAGDSYMTETAAAAGGADFAISSPEEYYSTVKNRIVENVPPAGDKENMLGKGKVKLEFYLSPYGEIVKGPDVIESSDHALDLTAMDAVRRAMPFPAFPEAMGRKDKRFVVDIAFE